MGRGFKISKGNRGIAFRNVSCRKTKDADQSCGYCAADRVLYFRKFRRFSHETAHMRKTYLIKLTEMKFIIQFSIAILSPFFCGGGVDEGESRV